MTLNAESKAALVFLILYTILFAVILFGYVTSRLSFRSRYTVILLHVAVRLSSQATGLAFGIVGYSNLHLLVAYFILGAEGYFTLVICTYRFLITWQYHCLESKDSWLEARDPPGTPFYKRVLDSFILFGPKRRPMNFVHTFLLAANSIIIAGGCLLANGPNNTTNFNSVLLTAKAMRATGQGVFLSITTFLLYYILYAVHQWRKEHQGSRVHPTLYILLAVWPLLFVRGLYGILAAVLPAFNYFNPSNYGANGLTEGYVTSEYILSTTMEWTSCSLLMITYFTSRNDPPDVSQQEGDDNGKKEGSPEHGKVG